MKKKLGFVATAVLLVALATPAFARHHHHRHHHHHHHASQAR